MLHSERRLVPFFILRPIGWQIVLKRAQNRGQSWGRRYSTSSLLVMHDTAAAGNKRRSAETTSWLTDDYYCSSSMGLVRLILNGEWRRSVYTMYNRGQSKQYCEQYRVMWIPETESFCVCELIIIIMTSSSIIVIMIMTHCFASVVEYRMHGADNTVLNIQIIISNVRAFFLEFRLCNGRTIAIYLHKKIRN